jgi:hypothetical protein
MDKYLIVGRDIVVIKNLKEISSIELYIVLREVGTILIITKKNKKILEG